LSAQTLFAPSAVMPRLDRGIQYAAASRFNHDCLWKYWIARSSRAMHCLRGAMTLPLWRGAPVST